MDITSIDSIRFQSCQHELGSFKLLRVKGSDRETFFQGQVTNDLNGLSLHQAHLTARLNRQGKVQSFFFLAKSEDCLYLVVPAELRESIQNDFLKFIIMEDVHIEPLDLPIWIVFNPILLPKIDSREESFDLVFYGLSARLQFASQPGLPQCSAQELEELRILNGWPLWSLDVTAQSLLNETRLNDLAISYKKGCFLGQETVAKVENNRGAAYYPVLLICQSPPPVTPAMDLDFLIDESPEVRKGGQLRYLQGHIFQATLFRDYRVQARQLSLIVAGEKIKVEVRLLPYFANHHPLELSRELFHAAVDVFQSNESELAKKYLARALMFDPTFSDAYESMGVILGREEKYLEAIAWMDKLLSVNNKSVMAHTNKSLFLMKLGRIEEAEEEKSKATVKTFASLGDEALEKKKIKEEEQKKEQELLRREKMFLQVLDIDPDDSIALYGMADIFFHRAEYAFAIKNLTQLLAIDSNYAVAYLLLGKCYEATGQIREARTSYETGIPKASKQGEMMPANEMQSRLNQLVVRSGLL